ncbi:MAG: ATP synthase F1 subunit epsilon [Firmicutes bacterium]|nr:ATP synthase F1 subunit epsilon [Bacillota bacterium]
MKPFPLKIVTPDGLQFEGQAEELIVRTITGDMGILAGHTNCVAPLGMGQATVVIDGEKRYAACIGGMVVITKEEVKLVPTTFEWAETIDVKRAEASEIRAKAMLEDKSASKTELKLAEARLKRALVRKSVAGLK